MAEKTFARMQLITPPPEEILVDRVTTAVKRKRTHPAPTSSSRDGNSMDLDATPNPKPRKQGRLHSSQSSFGSSTRTSLGYLGPPPVSNNDIESKPHIPRRRRVTQIPPYEPPRDLFTPPRVVFKSMDQGKSSKRKTPSLASGSKSTKGKKKGSALTILTAIKLEMPDIDLSLPMPPPSPSDDPLLLLAPPKREATDESMMQSDPDDAGISPVRLFGQKQEKEEEREVCQIFVDLENGEKPASPVDNLVPFQAEDGDKNSDDGDELNFVREVVIKEEGEVCQIPVDLENGEESANPFNNPVPLQGEDNDQSSDDGDHLSLVKITSADPRAAERVAAIQEEEGHREVRQISVDLDHKEPASPFDNTVHLQGEDNDHSSNNGDDLSPVKITSVDPRATEGAVAIQEEEDWEVRQISVDLDIEESASPFDNTVPPQREDDGQSSDDGGDLNLAKITGPDPRAAARAAANAILKQVQNHSLRFKRSWPICDEQHDYDCYTNIEVKREARHGRNSHSNIEDFAKESRRRDVSSPGVAKASISSRHRCSTLNMGVIGDTAFIPGSPTTTLPDLLQEAEHEVRVSPQSLSQASLVLAGRADPFKTPIAAEYTAQTDTAWMADQSSVDEREWTEEDWKDLDACFTDQRLEIGSRLAGAEQDLLAPVDIVSIDDVVDKFVVSKGGFDTVARFGALWSRETLLERTRALQETQRSEHFSAPTMSYAPLSVEAQDSLPQSETEETSSDVPSTTIGKRVKGFLFSYLPTLPKSLPAARKAPIPLQPSLPVPPIDILSKLRGPVITPARAPLSKPKHPKELVVLHPAPQPPKISHIPRMFKPRRLVELHPPAPLPIVEPTPIPRPRRSSGNSVKDLVRGFEELQTLSHDQLNVRMKSKEGLKRYADRRPRWK